MYKMKNNKLLLRKREPVKDDGLLVYTKDQRHESFEADVVASNNPIFPEGSIVIFSQYEGSEVYIDGNKYLILDADSVWCVKEGN